MTITYAQRISNQLATLRSDNSARGHVFYLDDELPEDDDEC